MEWNKEDQWEKSTCESCYKTAIDCCNSLQFLAQEQYKILALVGTIDRMLRTIGIMAKINGQERLEVHNDAW